MKDCLESDIKKMKTLQSRLRIYKLYEFLLKWLSKRKKCENLAVA